MYMQSVILFLYVYIQNQYIRFNMWGNLSDCDHVLCRMLIPTTELGRFDSMVMPFELEAYDILKSRSCKQSGGFYSYNVLLAWKKPKSKANRSYEKQVRLHRAKKCLYNQWYIFSRLFLFSAFSSAAFPSQWNPSTSPHHPCPRYTTFFSPFLFQTSPLSSTFCIWLLTFL